MGGSSSVDRWSYDKQYLQLQTLVPLFPKIPAITDWKWTVGTLTSVDGSRTFGILSCLSSFPYGDLERDNISEGKAFNQFMLIDVNNQKVYQSSTRYCPNVVYPIESILGMGQPTANALKEIVLPTGMYNPKQWSETNPTKPYYASLGNGLSEMINKLSKIEVVFQGMNYSPNTVVEIIGNGNGAIAQPIIRDGKIVQIHLLTNGQGYTELPQIVIKDQVGIGATAMAEYEYALIEGPLNQISITLEVNDQQTKTPIVVDLQLSQDQIDPVSIFRAGFKQYIPELKELGNNYYYSATRLKLYNSSIKIGDEIIPVRGTLWQDHQWGVFSLEAKWVAQMIQLNNGVTIHNHKVFDLEELASYSQKRQYLSEMVIQYPNGVTVYFDADMTPLGDVWISPISGKSYFLEWLIEIPEEGIELRVKSLVKDQELRAYGIGAPDNKEIYDPVYGNTFAYEGVGSVEGIFDAIGVKGTGWNEQHI